MERLWWVVVAVVAVAVADAAVYIMDYSNNMALEVRGGTSPCLLHIDKNKIERIAKNTPKQYLRRMSVQGLQALRSSCSDTEQVNKQGGFTFPGTKWCGPGNIAVDYNDLGPLQAEDRCCRDHDHCPIQLEPGQCRQGVCNTSPFTKVHCDCDDAFKKCLTVVNSEVADIIATIYFNLGVVTCFTKRRTCPHYMSEDPSYTWFCDEWKLIPSGEYLPPLPADAHGIPDEPHGVKPGLPPSSAIDRGLDAFQEVDVTKVMANSNPTAPHDSPKTVSSIFNSIPNGKQVWRD